MDAGGFVPQGAAVTVLAAGGQYRAQVMFRHCGDPNRYLVAWLGDAPDGAHPVADWVDAAQVTLHRDETGAGGGCMA